MNANRFVFKFGLGDAAHCRRSGIVGTVDGLCVYADGSLGVAILHLPADGSEPQTMWRPESLVDHYDANASVKVKGDAA